MQKNRLLPILFSVVVASCSTHGDVGHDYTTEVNPMIGTDYTGNTYPGAQAPFGMVQLSPDNGLGGWDRIAGYFYPDSTIAGFSHMHLSGTGAGDLYDISFMPVTFPVKRGDDIGVYSKFSHDSEDATAGYYKVHLDDYNIDVELTATERTGIQRYRFPGGKAAVILNLAKAMNWDATVDTEIIVADSISVSGKRYSQGWARDQRVYFATRFSVPFDTCAIDTVALASEGRGLVATFYFTTKPDEQVVVSTALSGVSVRGAMENLKAEAPDDDFDARRESSRKKWNELLGRVEVSGGTENQRTNFYTAMYHSMLAPTIFDDVDGSYRGPDDRVHKTDGWTNYSTFSLWDTFRAAHPLYTIVMPEKVDDMVNSFLAFYDQNGRLPVWNFQGVETDMMIGYHSVPVIVDAYLKGIGGFDAEKALDACVATANIDSYREIGLYKNLGYVPYFEGRESDDWSLSKTLEYAYDDYCIAKMAEKMGRKDVADEFYARSQNYRNVYNPVTQFMQPRDENGVFQPGFSPDEYTSHICESNGWHYFWSVQHDVDVLMKLIGGETRFAQRLDSMMTYLGKSDASLPIFSTGMIGQYAHGNEPSHHVIYLYNKVKQPWKTAEYVTKVCNELYRNEPAGLCGNEDCGQMSAWYVMSAMGFYPVDPVSGKYEIGTPMFEKVRVKVGNGKYFTVVAPGVSTEKKYVKSVTVDGVPWTKSYIEHGMIERGATVEFEMTSESGNVWF